MRRHDAAPIPASAATHEDRRVGGSKRDAIHAGIDGRLPTATDIPGEGAGILGVRGKPPHPPMDRRSLNAADARRTFRDVRVVHVGSLLSSGAPHVVPLWFVWLAEGFYVTCRRGSQVWRNLRRDPRVSLEVHRGQAWTEQAGVLIRGSAEMLEHEHPEARKALSAWFEKYRSELSGIGFAAYTEQVREPVVFVVRPGRLASWIHALSPTSGRAT